MTLDRTQANQPPAGPIVSILLGGMAGGMAWGIRGQYGHETGAMMFGVLVGFGGAVLNPSAIIGL